MSKYIPLTQNKFAIVDDDDFNWLNQYKWSAHKDNQTYYAIRRTLLKENKKRKQITMHREILQAKKSQIVDHIDNNGLNNQRHNLRFCDTAENCHNRRKFITARTTSQYKGVSLSPADKRWHATIEYRGRRMHLGRFTTQIAAAKAYDQAALKYHGKFARLNFELDNGK